MAVSYPVSAHFDLREFIHPKPLQVLSFNQALALVDPWLWEYAELLREVLDVPVYGNDWYRGGKLVGRGFRPRFYKPTGGAEYSMHYLSKAFDASTKTLSPPKMLEKVMDNESRFVAMGLTTIEHPQFTPGWLHGDRRPRVDGWHKPGRILIVAR